MPVLDSIVWKANGLRNRLADRLIERRLDIQTIGKQEVNAEGAVAYSTLSYDTILRVLDRLELGPPDVFVDIGCGKGRVACCAALRSVARVIGIDVDETLCAGARANAARLRGRQAPIEIVNMPAQRFDYRQCTAFYMFHPFGRWILDAVVAELAMSLRHHPRSIRLAYVNPVHEQALEESGFFQPYDHWPLRPRSRVKFAVSFWRAGAPR